MSIAHLSPRRSLVAVATLALVVSAFSAPAFSRSSPLVASASLVRPAVTVSARNVTANLFEESWPSIASECTSVLGPDGYAAVQVAPPEDSLKASGTPWWQVYQPVDYNLTSMMGTPAQFQAMVTACHNAGVKVYVDAVLNHMAAQSGSGASYGGQSYNPGTLTYPAYGSADFHSYPSNCPESDNGIDNWLSYTDVTQCRLESLPDLATQTTHVRQTEAAYLNALIAEGVDGFRLDAASSIGETDLAAIKGMLNPDTTTGTPVYLAQEVYPGSAGQDSRLNPTSFEPEGSVLAFDYTYALTNDFRGNNIAALNAYVPTLPSAYASTFVTNHDTERAGTALHYTDGAEYIRADEFLLAYGYGTPQIYSSFAYSFSDQSPPVDGSGMVTGAVCNQGTWECTEQNPAIVAMVGWHNLALTDNDPVANWTTSGSNFVAFSRGSDAWIAINNGTSPISGTFPTGLPNGSYCDIINNTYNAGACSGTPITVSGGSVTVTVPAGGSIAFDVNTVATTVTQPPAGTNLALGATMSASSAGSSYPASNANDNNTSSYWESTNGTFPQTLTANLGASRSLASLKLNLPPDAAWSTRTETLSVLTSTNGSSWTTVVGSAGYTFNPATGNTVSLSLPAGTTGQYVQLNITGNTGWSAAQISEWAIIAGTSSGGGSAVISVSPSTVAFGSVPVGTTSAAHAVTISNTGTASGPISVSTAAPFVQSGTCGGTLAAGASCTANVTFTPVANGAASGELTVTGSVSVSLSGTGTGAAPTNLALHASISASSVQQTYVATNANDGNTSTYWEGTNGAWPTTITVDLGATHSLTSVGLYLPSGWGARTQTLSILGSTNNSSYTTVVGSATYAFNPASTNTVTITLPAGTTDRYVRLSFTANNVQNGAQISELQINGT